ncbi:hypothetical protein EYF80_007438 [Liparis tanakae]|uniref:Uncharacterized protein n=1 Tax=Liparis tanakae TaxID=230148 RepID=A0A4Z2IX37_9TELE|nr:hypothetical protein EYF80_007438 [Liparis tanakae]
MEFCKLLVRDMLPSRDMAVFCRLCEVLQGTTAGFQGGTFLGRGQQRQGLGYAATVLDLQLVVLVFEHQVPQSSSSGLVHPGVGAPQQGHKSGDTSELENLQCGNGKAGGVVDEVGSTLLVILIGSLAPSITLGAAAEVSGRIKPKLAAYLDRTLDERYNPCSILISEVDSEPFFPGLLLLLLMVCTCSSTRCGPVRSLLSEGTARDVSSRALVDNAERSGSKAVIFPTRGTSRERFG